MESDSLTQPTVERDRGALGTVVLQPLDDSIETEGIELEIELAREDGVLVLGDLRRAALAATERDHFEAAHRLWHFVREAARRAGDNGLVVTAIDQGERALFGAQEAAGGASEPTQRRRAADRRHDRRKRASYDYWALAADVEGGMTKSAVAHKWRCATGTVSRAVSYVAQRNELVDAHPEVLDEISRGDELAELVDRYGLPSKVMRWVVSDYWDRRT